MSQFLDHPPPFSLPRSWTYFCSKLNCNFDSHARVLQKWTAALGQWIRGVQKNREPPNLQVQSLPSALNRFESRTAVHRTRAKTKQKVASTAPTASGTGHCQTSRKRWMQNQFRYPLLSRMAKLYLAIPATSVPSERVFSTAGDIVTASRACLKPGHVDKLIFLKKNFKEGQF